LDIGTRVRVVDEVEKPISQLIGKCGVIIGFKWNRYREERNLPVVKLDEGTIISGWSLWYEIIP
jgi:hypothetical protein